MYPFCRHRCGYCNFTVVAGRDDLQTTFLQALTAELQRLEVPRPVDTIYIGGGTPTQLTAENLQLLCQTDSLLVSDRPALRMVDRSKSV